MIIASAVDDSYVPHFATVLHSAWFHNQQAHFYLLDCGIAAPTLATLSAFADALGTSLTIVKIDPNDLLDCTMATGSSAAVYARLLLAHALPDSCRKAIYIDCDCVVLGNLSELWNIDIENNLLAAVEDDLARRIERRKNGVRNLPNYVNSGVMLVNLLAWRKEDFAEAALKHARTNSVLLHFDQTIINAVAAGRIRTISEKWNFMLNGSPEQRIPSIAPRIIHYAGPCKPWLYRDAMFEPIYLCHRNSTPYPITAPTELYRSRLRFVFNLILRRRKYRRMLALSQHCRSAFVELYLKRVAESNPSAVASSHYMH